VISYAAEGRRLAALSLFSSAIMLGQENSWLFSRLSTRRGPSFVWLVGDFPTSVLGHCDVCARILRYDEKTIVLSH